MHSGDEGEPVRGSSYVTIAYSSIRRLILSGEIPEGARVTVRPLAERLGLSPTPIRSALAALEHQGLLEVHAHRGYFVPVLSRDDLLEIYEIRENIEGIASRRAAQSPERASVIARLEELLEEQIECVAAGRMEDYGDLDVEFHRVIWRSSDNKRLVSFSDMLLGQLRVGNNISMRMPKRVADSLVEHRAIIEAIRAGDPVAAEHATREHVQGASAALANQLEH